jgi:serine-type D-Ala-D-Ala carboxypeptidase (penicillin-binding protein 5/6)
MLYSSSSVFRSTERPADLRHLKSLPAIFLFFCFQHLLCADNPISQYMSGAYPRTTSQYTVLMDVNTGSVLYSENLLAHRPPASLTKMAAAIVLIENGKLTDTVTAPDGLESVPESSLHLIAGEKISLHDLLYAMLLRSANDTPVAGSYYLCGGIAPFVNLMNNKVRQIGCNNTNFVTPNGLYAPGHYSCAFDLALIARYGLTRVPFFRQVVKTREYRVTRSIHKDDSIVTNTAQTFLKDFPGADGVKTGYISQAGHCFVGSATRNGWQLIAVALDSPKCRSDVVQMLSYGFLHFGPRLVYPRGYAAGSALVGGGRSVPVSTSAPLYDVVEKGKPILPTADYSAQILALPLPISENIEVGETVGSILLYRGTTHVMTVDALAQSAVAGVPAASAGRPGGTKKLVRTLLTVAALLFVAPVLYVSVRVLDLALHARKIAKNSRRRRSRLAEDVRTVDP